MRKTTALVLGLCVACGACVADDDAADTLGGEKADRPSQAADRGSIEPGTSRRARFTEPGQSHAYRMTVAAGAVVEMSADPIRSQEQTLKTTLRLYGPVAADGTVPTKSLGGSDDGSFGVGARLAAAGEYRIVVATATKRMVGTYDLSVRCSNLACNAQPVALETKRPPASLTTLGADVKCDDVSWCSATLTAYGYDGERPGAAALTEAVLKQISRGDEDWDALETLDADALDKALAELHVEGLLAAARTFAGARDVEALKVDGMVQIPIDDSGTDGFDQDLYLLHFPASKVVVALVVSL